MRTYQRSILFALGLVFGAYGGARAEGPADAGGGVPGVATTVAVNCHEHVQRAEAASHTVAADLNGRTVSEACGVALSGVSESFNRYAQQSGQLCNIISAPTIQADAGAAEAASKGGNPLTDCSLFVKKQGEVAANASQSGQGIQGGIDTANSNYTQLGSILKKSAESIGTSCSTGDDIPKAEAFLKTAEAQYATLGRSHTTFITQARAHQQKAGAVVQAAGKNMKSFIGTCKLEVAGLGLAAILGKTLFDSLFGKDDKGDKKKEKKAEAAPAAAHAPPPEEGGEEDMLGEGPHEDVEDVDYASLNASRDGEDPESADSAAGKGSDNLAANCSGFGDACESGDEDCLLKAHNSYEACMAGDNTNVAKGATDKDNSESGSSVSGPIGRESASERAPDSVLPTAPVAEAPQQGSVPKNTNANDNKAGNDTAVKDTIIVDPVGRQQGSVRAAIKQEQQDEILSDPLLRR